jgi:uncharacterized membrane protein
MKIAPATSLERTPDGAYVGAVGGTGLSDQDKKAIRKILSNASEPLMLGSIAARANVPMNTPVLQQQVSDFVAVYLTSTKEVEMRFDGESRKTGREIFRGFVGTDHLRGLIEKGLA